MALSEGTRKSEPRSAAGNSAPVWIFVLYLGGLLVVFLGERVFSWLPKGAGAISFLGVLAAVAATVLRFSPRFRSGGERKSIEGLLAILSLVGLLGLAIYFATSDFGATRLGLDKLTSATKTKVEELSRVAWVALIALSVVPMIFAETALLPMRKAERPESRRVRSAASAGLVLALAALYCGLFIYAASGLDFKVDYSYFKTSRPSESTRKLLQNLSGDPIRVVAFFPDVNEVRKEVAAYLTEAVRGAPKVKLELKDRLLEPKLAQELHVMQDGVVVLSRGTVHHSIQLGTDLEQARVKLKTLDQSFQEQVLKIARSKRIAYLTVGHGEINDQKSRPNNEARNTEIVRTLLQRQNYQIKDLGLAQGLANEVPDDADVVIVLGPTAPFAPEELAALKRYAERGGHLFMALEPEAVTATDVLAATPAGSASAAASAGKPPAAAPSASAPPAASAAKDAAPSAAIANSSNEELAALVGLKYVPTMLANEKQHVRLRYNDSDRVRLVSNSFSSHASVSTLSRNAPRAAVVVFGAASLEKANGPERVDFAVRAMPGTFRDENHNFRADQPQEKASSYNLGAAVTRTLGPAAPPADAKKDKDKDKDSKAPENKEMRAFVLSDADALADLVTGSVMGNQVLFLDAVRWLVGEESIQGLPNTEEDVRIEHTKKQDQLLFYGLILGVPLLVLGAGLFVSYRSRRRGGKR